jgi:predicted transcriptional regulator
MRRLDAYGRLLRRGRVFARLREGWAYDEIAREEGLTAERIRQIVREVLKKRPVDHDSDHAKLQLARLAPAMRVAGDAVLMGDVKAIAPFLKVLDRLDRLQKIAFEHQEEDDGDRQKLLDKLNQVAARLQDHKPEENTEAPEAS